MFRFELNYEEIGFDSIESMIESMQEKLTVNFYSSHLKNKINLRLF
jgi:hypothetical protein